MRWPLLEEWVVGSEVSVLALYVLASFFRAVPDGAQQSVGLVIGAFITHIGTFISYKWGSSAGSAAKDETIARALPSPAPPSPPPSPTSPH
jgi:hypothetical protein